MSKLDRLKRRYLSPILLNDIVETYGKKVADRYSNNIKNIEQRDYNIIGYGSLMKRSDAERNFNNIKSFKPGYVLGWRRVFDMGFVERGSWLNVTKAKSKYHIKVAVITIGFEDMFEFIQREILYDVEEVTVYDINIDSSEIANMVVSSNRTAGLEPILSYVGLCIEGIKEIGTNDDITKFLEETETYKGSLKKWLDELDIVDYFKRVRHASR